MKKALVRQWIIESRWCWKYYFTHQNQKCHGSDSRNAGVCLSHLLGQRVCAQWRHLLLSWRLMSNVGEAVPDGCFVTRDNPEPDAWKILLNHNLVNCVEPVGRSCLAVCSKRTEISSRSVYCMWWENQTVPTGRISRVYVSIKWPLFLKSYCLAEWKAHPWRPRQS